MHGVYTSTMTTMPGWPVTAPGHAGAGATTIRSAAYIDWFAWRALLGDGDGHVSVREINGAAVAGFNPPIQPEAGQAITASPSSTTGTSSSGTTTGSSSRYPRRRRP